MSTNIINTNLVFVQVDMQINAVVRKMIDRKVSSALVVDQHSNVVGIVTERDIVRKFTLLDLDQKWSKKIGTIMTREVIFANLATLKEDLVNLHFRHGFRHFPVLLGPGAREENVIGIVTVTDLCKEYLLNERRRLATISEKRLLFVPSEVDKDHTVKKLLSGLGYDVLETKIIDQLFVPGPQNLTLVVDLDGVDFLERDTVLFRLKSYNGNVIVLCPDRPEHGALKKFCSFPGRVLVTKPIDISYLNWILSRSFLPDHKAS